MKTTTGWGGWVRLVAGLLTFAGSRTVAKDPSSAGTPTTAQHGDELTGRVESFDRTKNTLTLSGKTLKLDSSTEITRDGNRASISDLKEGDQVRASFSGSGDTMAVQRLEVMTPDNPKPDAPKPPAATRAARPD